MKISQLQSLKNTISSRVVCILWPILVVMIVAGIVVTTLRVRQTVAAKRLELIAAGQLLAENIDHELENHVYNVKAMRNLAESYLSGYLYRPGNPADRLRYIPELDGYASPPSGKNESALAYGRIVGLGSVPAPDSPVVEEMKMAEALTPLMRAIRNRSPDTPWVYYTSIKSFMYLFPAEEADDFYFSPHLLEMEFLKGATPQVNSSRESFWTKPYMDEAGKGQMVTVSCPIYQGDQFKGSVSIDVSVKNLQYIMDMLQLKNMNVVLVSEDGQLLARHTHADIQERERGYEVHRLPLKLVPWQIELTCDARQLFEDALKEQADLIVGIVALASVLFFFIQLARHARYVRELSIHDSLTGLYNRRYFDEVAKQYFHAAHRGILRIGIILGDVDYFKKYNDTYGHHDGDMALVCVSKALKDTLLRGTDMVFRVGGEEFLILVFLQNQDTLYPILEKLNQAVREMKILHKFNPYGYVTISFGAIVLDRHGWMEVDAAYQRVDEALYQAKSRGRNCHVLLEPTFSEN